MITLISLLIALFTLSPNPSVESETRNVDEFQYIDVSGSITVNLIPSDHHKVDVEMLRGDSEELITEVKSNTLRLKFRSKGFNWNSNNKNKANVDVYYISLKGIDASAGSNVNSESEVVADNMELDGSSGSSIKLILEIGKLEVDVSSGASIKLEGQAKDQYVEVSSGASYISRDLKSHSCVVDASSGATAKVWVEADLDAEASSGASIHYKGNPAKKNIDAGKYSGGSIREM